MPAYTPKNGLTWNPLRKFPRNSPCPCGSNKKFKSCHLHLVSETCSLKEAKDLQTIVDMAKHGKNVAQAILRAEEKADA
jgi:uncharacterized protein YecA (UPF0149 family)